MTPFRIKKLSLKPLWSITSPLSGVQLSISWGKSRCFVLKDTEMAKIVIGLFWPIMGKHHLPYWIAILWIHPTNRSSCCGIAACPASAVLVSQSAKSFFPRTSERRVLLIVEVCHHIFSSSHLLIFTTSHLLIFTSSHLLIFASSHLHVFSSSHLHICSSSRLRIFKSSHLHIFSSSHLHTFTSSHLHIFSSSHLLIFTPSHLLIFSSSCLHIFSSSLSCSLALLPSCPLLSPSFPFLSKGAG